MAWKRLRMLLYPEHVQFTLASSLATLLLFSLVMFGLAFVMANRRNHQAGGLTTLDADGSRTIRDLSRHQRHPEWHQRRVACSSDAG